MFDRHRHHRRSVRLHDHDYCGPAWYFVTICAAGRAKAFGELRDGRVFTSAVGRIVEEEWLRIGQLRPGVLADAFVVMPNHCHGVVWLPGTTEPQPTRGFQRGRGTLGSIVAGFKSATTARIWQVASERGRPIWQRGYHESVLRSECALQRARAYVGDNPIRAWSAQTRKHQPPGFPDPAPLSRKGGGAGGEVKRSKR